MSDEARRLFAIIPAAGRSRRMGRPKLLLPLGDTTVIGRLVRTLKAAAIEVVLVLVHPEDAALAEEVRRHGASVVQPSSPPVEMRVSVEHLLDAVASLHAPTNRDGWLLVPGDHPLVGVETLGQLIAAWRARPDSIVLPTADGRRGHPTIFPWSLADQVRRLPADVGANQLLSGATAVLEVPVADPTIHFDLDTPADYERAISRLIP